MKYRVSLFAGVFAAFLSVSSLAEPVPQALAPAVTSSNASADYCTGLYCTGNIMYFQFRANGNHIFYMNSVDKDKLECRLSPTDSNDWVTIGDFANKKDIQSAVLSAYIAKAKITVKFEDGAVPCKVEWVMLAPRNN